MYGFGTPRSKSTKGLEIHIDFEILVYDRFGNPCFVFKNIVLAILVESTKKGLKTPTRKKKVSVSAIPL